MGWFGRRHLGLLLASLHPEVPSVKARCHGTISPLLDPYIRPAESGANILTQDPIGFGFQRKRVVGVYSSLLYVAEDRRQIVLLLQRPVRIVSIGRHHRDRRVGPQQKLSLQIMVGAFQRRHFRYP